MKSGLMAYRPARHDTRSSDEGTSSNVREQDQVMPITNVIRIVRRVLPTHAKIADDAKETIQECVLEFISFITSEANDRCQREQRKTITAEDVVWAMCKLGFDDYIQPLCLYLQKYREIEGDRKGSLRGDPLPTIKREPNMAMPSSSYGCSSSLGYQREVATGATMPFHPYYQYKI